MYVAQVRDLIYREILEYHPHMLADYLSNKQQTNFVYPSAVDNFKRQFAHLEGGGLPGRVPGHNGNLGQVCASHIRFQPLLSIGCVQMLVHIQCVIPYWSHDGA